MNFAKFAATSLSRKAEAPRFRGGPAAKLEQSADIAGGKDRGSKNPRLPARGHPEREDNRVRGADDGKGKLLSQVGDKNPRSP